MPIRTVHTATFPKRTMNTFNRFFTTAGIACALSLASASLQALSLDLSEADGYNLLTWGDATLKNSDTGGRVAAGGNVSFKSYSIGNQASADDPSRGSLVVGGKLNGTGGGQVANGSIYVGGSYSGPGYNLNSAPGSVAQSHLGKANLPFDFDAAQAALTSKSTNWGALAATGSSNELYSTLTLEGFDSVLNIFNIDAATLDIARTLEILIPTGAKALINVSGAIVEFSNKGIRGTHSADNTLFNFFEATELNMSSIGVTGSILAPSADLFFRGGQVNGQVIANSFQGARWGSGEMHNVLFNNDPEETTNVPDSGSTLAMIATALVGLIVISRKLKG